MNQVVSSQAILFITSVEIGILMGVLFDLIRIFRKLLKHPNFLVQVEDMLYWIACGLVGFYMLYVCNYADIRPYIFLGIVLGAVFYFMTFSILFMRIATIVINWIKRLVSKAIELIKIPIKACIRLIKIPLQYINRKWHHFCYLNKLRYRQHLRVQYQKQADLQVERYLKKVRVDLPKRKD